MFTTQDQNTFYNYKHNNLAMSHSNHHYKKQNQSYNLDRSHFTNKEADAQKVMLQSAVI